MLPETNNATLNFVETGKGNTTLVFLHYFGGSSKSWNGVIEQLKESFHCIAIDLRGFGDSPATL
ncbi:MAG: alpha/beta fold hydrolase [Chitinophagaceae bacterium]